MFAASCSFQTLSYFPPGGITGWTSRNGGNSTRNSDSSMSLIHAGPPIALAGVEKTRRPSDSQRGEG